MKNSLRILLGVTGLGIFGGSMFALGNIYGKEKEQDKNIWLLNNLNNIIDKYKDKLEKEKEQKQESIS